MIILDTNVVSEPLKPQANQQVIAWPDRQTLETLFLTAASLSELLLGVESLPRGKRQQGLCDALKNLIDGLFEARILPFDNLQPSLVQPAPPMPVFGAHLFRFLTRRLQPSPRSMDSLEQPRTSIPSP
jgi:hypothetical protein